MKLDATDPVAQTLVTAIRTGDLSTLQPLLAETPELANARIRSTRGPGRTPLHVVTDWPGFYPRAAESAQLLLDAEAHPDAALDAAPDEETPLQWAASTDDDAVARVLLAAGASVEVSHGSIGGPLDNAVGYECWAVARLLVERGEHVGLWQSAALGLTERLRTLLDAEPRPGKDQIDQAFWHACQGGQRRTAELLLQRGADLSARPEYAGQSALDAATAPDTRRQLLADWLRSVRP